MPLYTWTAKSVEELKLHAELKHPMVEDVDYHINEDGSINCKICQWRAMEKLPLSEKNKDWVEN